MFTNSTSQGFSHDHTTAGGGEEEKTNRKKDRARTVLFSDEVKIMHNNTHKTGDAQPGELCQLL